MYLYIHKKLNLINNLYYKKLIIFKSDVMDCNCYSRDNEISFKTADVNLSQEIKRLSK